MFQSGMRSSTGPTERFQSYHEAKELPSSMQPPGNRNVAGFRSAISCAMSFRRPFVRPLNLSFGISDTKSRSRVPPRSARICSAAFFTVAVGTNVAVNFRQSSAAGSKRAARARCTPLAPFTATRNGVSPRAQSDSSSGAPFSTLISCIGPSFITPAPPSNASILRYAGVLANLGFAYWIVTRPAVPGLWSSRHPCISLEKAFSPGAFVAGKSKPLFQTSSG